jgi:hypothetical protein
MKYTVISGEFKTVVESNTPRAAAEEAFSLWRMKIKKPNLSKITMVVKPDNKEVYLPTNDLMGTIHEPQKQD